MKKYIRFALFTIPFALILSLALNEVFGSRGNTGYSNYNNYPCNNYLHTPMQACGDPCNIGSHSAATPFSAMGSAITYGNIQFSPSLHSVMFPTGGNRVGTIGDPLFILPTLIYRSFTTYEQNDVEGLQFVASFDTRVVRSTYNSFNIAQYRDKWGNPRWYKQVTSDIPGKDVYRTYVPGSVSDSLGGRSGLYSVLTYQSGVAEPYEILYGDGRKRTFNSDGWLYRDYDRNNNYIQYNRNANNYVTSIVLPGNRTVQIVYGSSVTTRIEQIQYPDGTKYIYGYTGDTAPFIMNEIRVLDENNNELKHYGFTYESLTSGIKPDYGNWDNTGTDYRITSIVDKNRSNEILVRFGYDNNDPTYGYDPSDPAASNYANEVKRIGDKDVWFINSPPHDMATGEETDDSYYALEGIVNNAYGGATMFYCDEYWLQLSEVRSSALADSYTTSSGEIDDVLYNYFPVQEYDLDSTKNFNKTFTTYYQYLSNQKSIESVFDFFFEGGQGLGGTYVAYDSSDTDHFLAGTNVVESSVDLNSGTSGKLTTRYEYALDKKGNPLKKIVVDESGENIVSTFTHDSNGNVLTAVDPLGYTTSFSYDGNGQLDTVTSPMNRTVDFDYNTKGDLTSITDPNNREVSMTYDSDNSALLSVTSPMSKTLEIEYDALQRPTRIEDPDGYTAMTASYDDVNQIVTHTDAVGKVTKLDYNPKSGSTSARYIRTDAYGEGSAQTQTQYLLNDNKTVNRINYPDGTYKTFTYDGLGRARESTLTDGANSIYTLVRRDSQGVPRYVQTKYNNANSKTISYNYNTDMTLQSVTDENSKTFIYTYDGVGRVATTTRPSGNTQNAVETYTYNDAGQLTETVYGSYAHAKYYYNKDGQTRLVVRWISTGYYVLTEYTYNSTDGRLTGIQHKRSTQAPSYSASTDAISYNGGTLTMLTSFGYTFDNDGRMTGKTRVLYNSAGSVLRSHSCTFGYDNLGRITSEYYDLGYTGGQFSRSYSYNRAGNRTLRTANGVQTSYTYATLASQHTNQLSAASVSGGNRVEYLYDSMGNRTAAFIDSNNNDAFDTASESGTAYVWNLAGQLVDATVWSGGSVVYSIQYTYDGNGTGQLMDRTVNGSTTRFYWDGFTPYMEASGSNMQYAYFGANVRIDLGGNYRADTSDAAHVFLRDEAGNVVAVTNKTGTLESHFEFDAWGNDLNDSFSTTQNVRLFRTGKFFDSVTGLYYNQARWYDPTQGRFISESPISPFSEEEYAYCKNSPTNLIDVSGLEGNPIEDYLVDPILVPVLDCFQKNIIQPCADVIDPFVQWAWYYELGYATSIYQSHNPDGYDNEIIPGASNIVSNAIAATIITSAGKKVFKRDYFDRNTNQYSYNFKSGGHARAFARTKLGKNPVKVEANKWRSQNRKWQYRAKPGDLMDKHIHLEELDPDTGRVINNHHLYWSD